MKHLLGYLMLSVIFTVTSCELLDFGAEDDCEKLEEFQQSISVCVVVETIGGGLPIEDIGVKINTWKVHCDGHKGYPPTSEWEGKTNDLGKFCNGFTSFFKMNTAKDEIHTSVTLYDKYGEVITTDGTTFSYWYCKNNLTSTDLDLFKIRIDDKYFTGNY